VGERALSLQEQKLAEATKHAVQEAGGLDACREETGKSNAQLSRCCSKFEPDSITIRDAVMIDAIGFGRAGHPFILRAMARALGFVLVRLPEVHEGTELTQGVTDLACELGDVAQAIRDGTSANSPLGVELSAGEGEAILSHLDDLDAVSARMRLTVQKMVESAAASARRN